MNEYKSGLLLQLSPDGEPGRRTLDNQGYIRAIVLTVEALFGRNRSFNLPWFQRAFAWREPQVAKFVADLLEAMRAPNRRYSLGQVWFGGSADADKSALVDGHQRTITLTMMFAILRDQVAIDQQQPEAERKADSRRLHALIAAPVGSDLPWRLTPQAQVADFFQTFVQTPGGTVVSPGADLDDLTPAERHLLACRDQLRSILTAWSPLTRHDFIEFVLTRCFLVSIEVDDEDEAWTMLGIEQTTRLPHDISEESKIALVYSMPALEQDQANLIWEQCQSKLGCSGIGELLQHLRSAKLTKRSTKPLDGELQQLYALNRSGLEFMQGVFQPNALTLDAIEKREISTGAVKAAISQQLEHLSWLDHRQWVAPALVWLTKKGVDHAETPRFFARLDRLAWMLRLAGTDPNEQELRFIKACAGAERRQLIDKCPEFAVDNKTITAALTVLRSRTFYLKHMASRALRRICATLGDDPGPIDGIQISVEHVLPRRPSKDKRCWSHFGSADVVLNHTDRLGNLALLTGPQNRAADRSDWKIKRDILKASGFSLSVEAATNTQWTQQTIETRTEKLIALLFAPWGLSMA